MKATLTLRYDPEIEHVVDGVDSISFLDDNSHGAARTFNIKPEDDGRKVLLLFGPGLSAVEVET